MEIHVTFRHMEPTEALKEYARQKLDKIKKFMRRPIEAHVVLSVERHFHIAEVNLRVNGITIRGVERTQDMYSSIDRVLDKLDQQIRKYKDRLRDHHHRDKLGHAAAAAANYFDHALVAQDVGDEREAPTTRIEKAEKLAAPPMIIDDAVMQMDLSGAQFMVFTNLATNRLSILYRLPKGGDQEKASYGLLETSGTPAQAAPGAAPSSTTN